MTRCVPKTSQEVGDCFTGLHATMNALPEVGGSVSAQCFLAALLWMLNQHAEYPEYREHYEVLDRANAGGRELRKAVFRSISETN